MIPAISDRPTVKQFNGSQIDTLKKLLTIHKASRTKFPAILIAESGNASACDIELPMFDSMPCDYGINVNYLLDSFLAANHGDVYLSGRNDSAMIKNGDFTAVVMPMRL